MACTDCGKSKEPREVIDVDYKRVRHRVENRSGKTVKVRTASGQRLEFKPDFRGPVHAREILAADGALHVIDDAARAALFPAKKAASTSEATSTPAKKRKAAKKPP